MVFDLFVVLLLILANAFFVVAEFAIVKVRITQLSPLIEAGSKRARIARHITSHLNRYLSATQVGITLASLGLGWIAEPIFETLLGPLFRFSGIADPKVVTSLSAGFGFALITFLHITLGEQAPKALAIQYPRAMTLFTAIPLQVFTIGLRPFIMLLNGSSILFLRMIGIRPAEKADHHHSEEELRLLLKEGERTGIIDDTEHELIENIFDFADKSAGEILVPRTQMFTLQADIPTGEAIRLVVREGYSRIPIYDEDQDHIIGVLFSKDLLKGIAEGSHKSIRDLLRPVHVAVHTRRLGDLLREMQKQHVELAIVVNEYGGLEGMVTTEDILEEIVGEIQDEHDSDAIAIYKVSERSYVVPAVTPIDEFNEKLHAGIPSSPHYSTIGGFVLKLIGRIPVKGERSYFDDWEFRVEQVTKNRILTLRITAKPPQKV